MKKIFNGEENIKNYLSSFLKVKEQFNLEMSAMVKMIQQLQLLIKRNLQIEALLIENLKKEMIKEMTKEMTKEMIMMMIKVIKEMIKEKLKKE